MIGSAVLTSLTDVMGDFFVGGETMGCEGGGVDLDITTSSPLFFTGGVTFGCSCTTDCGGVVTFDGLTFVSELVLEGSGALISCCPSGGDDGDGGIGATFVTENRPTTSFLTTLLAAAAKRRFSVLSTFS